MPTGELIAFWTTEALDPFERSLRGQLFDAFGGRQGSEFFVADASLSTDIYGGSRISAATLADGRVVVTWAPFGGDGNADGIVSQIFDPRDGVVTETAAGQCPLRQRSARRRYRRVRRDELADRS